MKIFTYYLLLLLLLNCKNSPPETGDDNLTTSLPNLIWPLDKPLHDETFISNYVDLRSGSGTLDYQCGSNHTYDGHNGTDIAILNYKLMDKGVGVIAAADGEVTFVRDTEFDRNYTSPSSDPPNIVVVSYPGTSNTLYAHLRKNSVSVQVNEQVKAGDFLGYIATSGSTPIPHLHFETGEYYTASEKTIFDPFEGDCQERESLWNDQPEYVGNAELRILDADIFTDFSLTGGHQFGEERVFKDRPLRPAVYGIDQPRLGFWVQLQGNAGQSYQIKIEKPDGSLFTGQTATLETKRRYGWDGFNWPFDADEGDFGTWSASVIVGGKAQKELVFEVGQETEHGPRFYPIAGKSYKAGSPFTDVLQLHQTSGEVNFELVNPPSGISLTGNEITFGGDSDQVSRNHFFQVVATDGVGRKDTMFYHLIDYSKSIIR